MAINFPDSPSVNDTHTVLGKTWVWNGTYWKLSGSSNRGISLQVSDTAPSDPVAGDMWYESDTGRTFTYYDGAWIELGNTASVTAFLADADADTLVHVEESADSDTIAFTTGGTKRLEIDASGHVIPAANETYDLGSASNRFRDLYLSGTSINLGGAEISSDGTNLTMPPVSNISGDFTVDTDTLHVDSTNNRVGIGTATPAASLTVTSGTDDAKVKIDSNGGSVGTIDATANTNDATNRWLSINPSGGNVGIGTTTPGYQLEVDNTLTVKGTSPYLRILETTTSADAHLWLGQDGTAGEGLHVWYESSTGASYVDNIFNNASLYLRTNNGSSTGVGIDVLGRVTTPNQPSFYARGTTTGTSLTTSGTGSVLAFNTAIHNIGNHYNTSTYRFTAPVNGVYLFILQVLIFPDAVTGNITISIKKNGSGNVYDDPGGLGRLTAPPSQTSIASQHLLQLSAGDYIEPVGYVTGSGKYYLSTGHSIFAGHLLG